ncbi:MAG: FixH family protein [Planctomycetota bacterium JB042]
MSPKVVWVGLVVLLLGMSVVIQGTALFLANSDPSFAVEEDYERKAAAWDDLARRRRASDALGWAADVSTRAGDRRGDAVVRVSLADRNGLPVEAAEVVVETFHNARASRVLTDVLRTTDAPGVYEATLPMRRPGLWELRITATRGEDVFLRTLRKSVLVGG